MSIKYLRVVQNKLRQGMNAKCDINVYEKEDLIQRENTIHNDACIVRKEIASVFNK